MKAGLRLESQQQLGAGCRAAGCTAALSADTVQLHPVSLYSCTRQARLYSCTRQGCTAALLHSAPHTASLRPLDGCLGVSPAASPAQPAQPSPAQPSPQPGYCLQCGQAGVVWCRVPCLARPSLHSPDDDNTPIYLPTHRPLSPGPILSSLVTNSPPPSLSIVQYTTLTNLLHTDIVLSTVYTFYTRSPCKLSHCLLLRIHISHHHRFYFIFHLFNLSQPILGSRDEKTHSTAIYWMHILNDRKFLLWLFHVNMIGNAIQGEGIIYPI